MYRLYIIIVFLAYEIMGQISKQIEKYFYLGNLKLYKLFFGYPAYFILLINHEKIRYWNPKRIGQTNFYNRAVVLFVLWNFTKRYKRLIDCFIISKFMLQNQLKIIFNYFVCVRVDRMGIKIVVWRGVSSDGRVGTKDFLAEVEAEVERSHCDWEDRNSFLG